MKSSVYCLARRSLSLSVIALSPALMAQTASPSGDQPQVFHGNGTPARLSDLPPGLAAAFANGGRGGSTKTTVAAFETAVANAKALAKGGDLTGAENAVTKDNVAKPNTAAWHVETSRKLLEVARQVGRDGDTTHAIALATSCLQHLGKVAALSSDTHVQARAKAQAAFIHLRYIGDPQAAIAEYADAVQLDPKDSASLEALTRLQAADATLRERVKHNQH